jgi:hypothetical protein
MATLPLVPSQMDAVIQALTLAMGLNLSTDPNPNNPDSPNNPNYNPLSPPPNYYGCRIGWQQQGQPQQRITEDVVYVREIEIDDQYNRIRDVSYDLSEDGNTYTKTTNYTRVWRVFWCVYGPNSFDNARKIHSRLFDQDIHDQFAASQLYWVTDAEAPVRAPEPYDRQWWERVDFSARFNEFVTEEYVTQYALSTEIIIDNELGTEIADITVTAPGVLLTEQSQPIELENGGKIINE